MKMDMSRNIGFPVFVKLDTQDRPHFKDLQRYATIHHYLRHIIHGICHPGIRF